MLLKHGSYRSVRSSRGATGTTPTQQMTRSYGTSLGRHMHISAIGLGKNALRGPQLQPAQGVAQRLFALAGTQRAKLPAAAGKPGALHQILNVTIRSFASSGLLMMASRGRPFQHRPPSNQATPSANFLTPIVRRINRIPGNTILYLLIGLNVVVFLAWQYAVESWRRFGDPRAYLFMTRNFLCGMSNLSEGRFWTLINSCISHENTSHLFVNMLSLAFTGTQVISVLGNSAFLGLYFSAGIASALISTGWHRYVDPWLAQRSGKKTVQSGNKQAFYSHGASGSVYAILSTFACLAPKVGCPKTPSHARS